MSPPRRTDSAEDRTPKTCPACGRRFEWRKKWERDWATVKYCSHACRRAGVRPVDEQLERAILELLAARGPGKTICPSEAARMVAAAARSAGPGSEDAWRPLMEPARRAGRRLAERGELVITQRGRPVDPSTARGPIRFGRG
jgi:hypothetical protein